MPRSTEKTRRKPGIEFLFPQMEFMPFNGNLFSAYAQAGQAFVECAVALNTEVMRFTNQQLEAGARVLHDLPACTSWEEAAAMQSDYLMSCTQACLAEVPKLTEQAARSCNAMCAPILECAQAMPESTVKSWMPRMPEAGERGQRAEMSQGA